MNRRHTMQLTTSAFAVFAALAAGGCSQDGRSDLGDHPARDSSGVKIVANGADAVRRASEWRIEGPELIIGSDTGSAEYAFFRIRDAVRLDDGRIALIDGGTQELRVFDARGVHQVSFGGEGSGPREFKYPERIVRYGADSLLVWDISLRRATVLSVTPEFGRTITLAGTLSDDTELIGVSETRAEFVIAHWTFDSPSTGSTKRALELWRYSLDGQRLGLAAVHSSGSLVRLTSIPGIVTSPAFEAKAAAAANATVFVAGSGNVEEFSVYHWPDERVLIVRWPRADRRVTEDHIRHYRAQHIVESEPPELRRRRLAFLDERPVAEEFPAYDELLVDSDGLFWVHRFVPPGYEGASTWLVFHPNGAVVARVEMPRELRVRDVGRDYVLGVGRNDLGVEQVWLFRLNRESEGSGQTTNS